MEVKLLAVMPNPQLDHVALCAQAAAVCRDQEPTPELLERVIAAGHTSVTEHAWQCDAVLGSATVALYGASITKNYRSHNWRWLRENGDTWHAATVKLSDMPHYEQEAHGAVSFLISGISIACARQLMRHRAASYTERSLRHCRPFDAPVIPQHIQENDFALKKFIAAFKTAMSIYDELRITGSKLEDARAVLPLCTATRLVATFPLWSLVNFFAQRRHNAAQGEIRLLADALYNIVKPLAPGVFDVC